jgi:predicted  nucleic acid-binding Zn-ribbon protein
MDDLAVCTTCGKVSKILNLGQHEGGEGYCPACGGKKFTLNDGDTHTDPQYIRAQCIVELADKRYAGMATFTVVLDSGWVSLRVGDKTVQTSPNPALYEKLYDYCEGKLKKAG